MCSDFPKKSAIFFPGHPPPVALNPLNASPPWPARGLPLHGAGVRLAEGLCGRDANLWLAELSQLSLLVWSQGGNGVGGPLDTVQWGYRVYPMVIYHGGNGDFPWLTMVNNGE